MENQMVKFEEKFAVLAGGGPADIMQALQENLPGESLGPGDIDKATIPGGSSAAYFSVPSLLKPDGEMVAEIVGIIVHQSPTRAMFEKSFEESGGDEQPLCASDDGVVGYGEPGGACAGCAFSKFHEDEAPKCKIRRSLYILREGQMFPLHVSIPTASYGEVKKRLASMVKAGVAYWKVLVKLTLVKDKNPAGLPYYQVKLDIIEQLTPEQVRMVEAYQASIKPSLARNRQAQAA